MSSLVVIPTKGRVETATLTRALLDAASRGLRPHCSDPVTSEMWLSESEADRAEAVKLCRGCPVIDPCREVGKHQTFGVFGGVDRSRRPGKKAET